MRKEFGSLVRLVWFRSYMFGFGMFLGLRSWVCFVFILLGFRFLGFLEEKGFVWFLCV